jgi:hypothetical protein
MRRDAERGVDCGVVVPEPLAVLLERRRVAGRDAKLALDSQKLLK